MTPDWINVKERLPEYRVHVLAYRPSMGVGICVLSQGTPKLGDLWVFNSQALYDNQDVTHWMPLPDPPKEVR